MGLFFWYTISAMQSKTKNKQRRRKMKLHRAFGEPKAKGRKRFSAKKALSAATLILFGVMAGSGVVSASETQLLRNSTEYNAYLFTWGENGDDFYASATHPKDNTSDMVVRCVYTNYPMYISAIGSHSSLSQGSESGWTSCSQYNWRRLMTTGDTSYITNTVIEDGFSHAGLLGEVYSEEATDFKCIFRTDCE
jgi:hypothetical protein